MKPQLDRPSGQGQVTLRGPRAAVLLTLLLSLGAARADFTGDFGEAFWTKQPAFGSISFTNSSSELIVAGPNAPASSVPLSLDGILYGQLSGGLVVGGLTSPGTVQFHWDYNAGGVESGQAAIAWRLPGEDTSTSTPLNLLTGPGVIVGGDFTTPLLAAGTTFEFLLTTDTTAGKLNGTLIITDFQFNPVPEPTAGALFGSALISLGAAHWWRSRRQVSGQP